MLSLSHFKQKLRHNGTIHWPATPRVEFFWSFELKASRAQIWSVISDTSRLNREMGFGSREQKEENGKLLVSTSILGMPQRWQEEPWSWLAGYTLSSTRTYFQGIAKKMHSVFHIDSDEKTDRRTVYIYFGWDPTHWSSHLFLLSTANLLKKSFAKALQKIDGKNLENEHRTVFHPFRKPAPPLSETSLHKISEIKNQLLEKNLKAPLVERLLTHIVEADDLDLEPIRILALAKEWKEADTRELLKICLHSTRLGLLNISWDAICPHCRGTRYSAENLGSIPVESSCDVCQTVFSTDHANSIEVMFHVHPTIRKVEVLSYCAAEPAKKNHIRLQHILPAGQGLSIEMNLPAGRYQARNVGGTWEAQIEVDAELPPTHLELESTHRILKIGSPASVNFKNLSSEPVIFVLEEIKWDTCTLKPAQVFALPEFRDLFSEDHLNSQVKLFLGEQTILFTDIVGSSEFYQNVGDAKAFSQVRLHFRKVFQLVIEHQGVIVKTIGDSVMASFPSPIEAMRAAVVLQEHFAPSDDPTRIRLRISVHSGPVIAVHLNTGIDYFGHTVNFAAKIQSCANAGEIAFSQRVATLCENTLPHTFPVLERMNRRDAGEATSVKVLQVNPLEKPDQKIA